MLITGRSADPAQAEALADVTAEELIVELGGQKSLLRTLEPAVASPLRTDDIQGPGSRPSRALLLGGFGLLLGVGAGFTLDRFDSRIRSKRTAEDALGVPVMAEIPPIPRSARGRMLTGAQRSSFIESSGVVASSSSCWRLGLSQTTPVADAFAAGAVETPKTVFGTSGRVSRGTPPLRCIPHPRKRRFGGPFLNSSLGESMS